MGRARIGSWELVVEEDRAEAPYSQVVNRLAAAIGEGELPRGLKLPSVRALAGELGLAVNTVAKAYRQLENETLVETRGRNGTVVLGHSAGDELTREIEELVTAAKSRGLRLEEVLGEIRRAW